jgi:hypothetical protein
MTITVLLKGLYHNGHVGSPMSITNVSLPSTPTRYAKYIPDPTLGGGVVTSETRKEQSPATLDTPLLHEAIISIIGILLAQFGPHTLFSNAPLSWSDTLLYY